MLMPIGSEAGIITVCVCDFTYIQDTNLERNKKGEIIEYWLQVKYENPYEKVLHSYGRENLCYFKIDAWN